MTPISANASTTANLSAAGRRGQPELVVLTDDDFLSLPDAEPAELDELLEPDSLEEADLDSEPADDVPFAPADDDSLPADSLPADSLPAESLPAESLPELTVLEPFRLSVR